MVFPRGKVDDEFHGRVEQLGHEDQEYGQNKDREFQLPDSDQQARHEDDDGHDDVEAHVALGADRVDHTPVGVLKAADYALLTFARWLNFPRHATPLSLPAGASPSHWPRSPPRVAYRPSVARRAPRDLRHSSHDQHIRGRSQPPLPSPHMARLPRN